MSPISITVVFKLAPNWKHESILFVANEVFDRKINEALKNITLHKKTKFSITHFFSKCGQIFQETANLVTFAEEARNGKHFLCSAICSFPDRNLYASTKHNLYLAQ